MPTQKASTMMRRTAPIRLVAQLRGIWFMVVLDVGRFELMAETMQLLIVQQVIFIGG
jgi:hypothetical protein